MKQLIVEGTAKTPEVCIDLTKGTFKISGNCLPEDSPAFWKPIINFILENKGDFNENFKIAFNFNFLNSSSTKMVRDLIIEIPEEVKNVYWLYPSDDPDIKEIGKDFFKEINKNIKIVNLDCLDPEKEFWKELSENAVDPVDLIEAK